MGLAEQLTTLAQAVAADVKALLAAQGNLSALTTTQKANLVGAINELDAEIASLAAGAGAINDNAAANDTASTYSAAKIQTLLASTRDAILGGAGAAYDTLAELQALLTGQDNALAGLLSAVNNRVAYDAAQSLTGAQKATARGNIGAASAADLGDTSLDPVAAYNSAKA